METLIEKAAQELANAKKVVVFTGAGISKESGVPTFRDALDGLWSRYDPTELATPQAFERNPKLVWDWYIYRRDLVAKTQPNPGHYALAELETLLPSVVLVTQNVDHHHHLAGSKDIIRLHGDLFAFKCSRNCQGSPTPVELSTLMWNPEEAPPSCPFCGVGRVRPDVVWFGEGLPSDGLQRAFVEAENCDVMIVVGTSGVVYPAAWLPIKAMENQAFVIEVNPYPSEISSHVNVHLQAPSGEALPKLVSAVRALLASQ